MKLVPAITLFATLLTLSAPLASQTFDSPQGYYEDASRLYSEGDPEAAAIQLRNALQLYTDHAPSLLLLGQIRLEQRASGEAIQLLEDALLQGADPTIVVRPLARAYLQRGEYTRLINRLPLEQVPASLQPTVLAAHAEASVALGRLGRAEARLEQGLALDPGLPDLRMMEVTIRLRQGELDEAERLANKLVNDLPSDSRSWTIRASVHQLRGEHDAAIQAYEKSVELAPFGVDSRIALISLYIDRGELGRAQGHVDWMREEVPADPRAAYFSALLAARSGDEEKEASEIEAAAEIFDAVGQEKLATDPQMQMMSGLVYYSAGAFEKARGPISQYLAGDRENAGVARLLASILLAMNEPAEAVQLLQPFHRRSPEDEATTLALADALNAAGNPLEAARLLESIPAIGSGTHYGDSHLAKALLDSGDTAKGTSLLEQTLTTRGQNEGSLLLAVAHLRNEEFDAARAQIQTIATRDGWSPLLTNLDAIALAGSGQADAALSALEDLTRKNPDFYPAWANLSRLQRSAGNWLGARSSLQRARRLAPDEPRLDYEMALQFLTENDPQEALRHAERAAINSPGNLTYAMLETELQFSLGNPADALDAALRASSYENAPAAMRRLLASAYARTGDVEQALITLQRAARAADFDAVELHAIAEQQMALGDFQTAVSTLDKALKGDANYLPAKRAQVQSQIGLGNARTALSMANTLVNAYPNEASQHLLKGEAAMAAAEYATALQAFEQAETLDGADVAVIGQVDALQALSRSTAAKARLAHYVDNGGRHPELRGRYSDLLIKEQDWNSALPVLQRLAEDYPQVPTVINNLAAVQHELNDPQALETARRALELAPANPYSNDTLGWILLQQGETREALGYLREATTRAAQEPELRYHLAVALNALGRQVEARAELEQALATDTPFDRRDDARTLLSKLSTP